MVYVFGMNIPLLEILVVFLVLLGIGLVLIILELKKLRQLITEERSDIAQFEADLSRFEKDEQNAGEKSDDLDHYIKQALAKGIPTAQIEDVLIKRGWDKEKVEQYLK